MLSSFHPTKQSLIVSTALLMETNTVAEITSEEVLRHSGVSKGSLYHHFQDFAELMTFAQIFMFSTFVDATVSTLATILEASQSREELLKSIKEVSRLTQSPMLNQMRYVRMVAISNSIKSEKIRTLLGREQTRLNQALATVFRHSQEKGWGAKELDPKVVAVFLQAYTLGRVVDDFSPIHTTEENWNQIIDQVLEEIFFPKVKMAIVHSEVSK